MSNGREQYDYVPLKGIFDSILHGRMTIDLQDDYERLFAMEGGVGKFDLYYSYMVRAILVGRGWIIEEKDGKVTFDYMVKRYEEG